MGADAVSGAWPVLGLGSWPWAGPEGLELAMDAAAELLQSSFASGYSPTGEQCAGSSTSEQGGGCSAGSSDYTQAGSRAHHTPSVEQGQFTSSGSGPEGGDGDDTFLDAASKQGWAALLRELDALNGSPFGDELPGVADPSLLTMQDLLARIGEVAEEQQRQQPTQAFQDGDGSYATADHRAAAGARSSYDSTGMADERRGRRLQQAGGGGLVPTNYSNAFRLIFGNFFDLLGGGGRLAATLAAEASSLLINLDWIRDLAYLVDAPIDNIVNSNFLPLPQSTDALIGQLTDAVSGYCRPEAVGTPRQQLGSYTGPTLAVALAPATCPIKVDARNGSRSIDWDKCTAAKLTVSITPALYRGKQYTAATYAGKQCRYTRYFGSDRTFTLGGGSTSLTFRRSKRGLDIVPVLNQFLPRGQFAVFNENQGNGSSGNASTIVTDAAAGGGSSSSSAVAVRTVGPGAAHQLQRWVPGETLSPESNTGAPQPATSQLQRPGGVSDSVGVGQRRRDVSQLYLRPAAQIAPRTGGAVG